MAKTMFTLQILHGGKFIQGEQVTYVNGEEYISTVDSDFMSYFELMDIMKDAGEWHDDVQINSDKEAFSGMEESSTDDEEELSDKEVGVTAWSVSKPCVHGVTAIISNKSTPEDFVNEYYHCTTFTRTYNRMITPIPGQTMWLQINYDKIMPPHIRKRAGRPKKNGKKAENEPKNPIRVRKHYTSLRCSKCKEVGHNSRTCQKIPHEAGKGKQPMQTMSQGRGKGKIVPNKPMGCNAGPPLQN
ncbi:hypothetical protein Acr_11g0010380 [Actinidia rufa]|uniref:PB1-like domain-containing protein n=1 Tax=Actinidia rufa TaxID=165716 RepID=A0A7J0FDF5_9ERIC|nr:hypothetical protein Acr_11g0010380 [Actinidia rufa]